MSKPPVIEGSQCRDEDLPKGALDLLKHLADGGAPPQPGTISLVSPLRYLQFGNNCLAKNVAR